MPIGQDLQTWRAKSLLSGGFSTGYPQLTTSASTFNFSSFANGYIATQGFTYAAENKNGATDYYEMEGKPVAQKNVGGTVSWRNNNPGNIVFVGQSAAIGSYYDAPVNHTFAIFPDYATGVQAAVSTLQGGKYAGAGLSINQGMKRWTGASGEKLRNYDNTVDAALGLPGSTLISTLSSAQLQTMVTQGIQVAEGWKPGKIVIPKQKSATSVDFSSLSRRGGGLTNFVSQMAATGANTLHSSAVYAQQDFATIKLQLAVVSHSN